MILLKTWKAVSSLFKERPCFHWLFSIMEKQNRESHCVQGSGIFLVGAGDRRQPYLSPVRCSSGMFSALNEKTGTRSRIGLIQFYYNWEEDKKYLLVEIDLAKQI